MSELQAGLIALGVLVVAVVLVYNALQERKFRRDADAGLRSENADVLIAGVPAEAGATATRLSPPETRTAEDARIEPTFDKAKPEGEPMRDPLALDDRLDFIVPIESGEDIDGADLNAAAAGPLAGFRKRVRLEGYNEQAARWEGLTDGTRYCLMRAGIQLVDRQGATAGEELIRFGAAVQQAAASAGALASVPERDSAVALAGALDRFCAENDILVAVGICSASGTPFPGTRLRALAEAAGMSLDPDGRFRRHDGGGVWWELANRDGPAFSAEGMRTLGTSGITLEFDVPRTPGGTLAFGLFREFASHLAQGLGGRLVDDDRKPLSPEALVQITARVEAVHRAMRDYGIEAGSPAALRLFS